MTATNHTEHYELSQYTTMGPAKVLHTGMQEPKRIPPRIQKIGRGGKLSHR